jgi:hypothetical protein
LLILCSIHEQIDPKSVIDLHHYEGKIIQTKNCQYYHARLF